MANTHFGNLADVFKHLALAEVLAQLCPAEYWESHAGAAFYEESAEIPLERRHGIHTFHRLASQNLALGGSAYARALSPANPLQRIAGSTLLARRILGHNVRRFLFCDTDAASLQSIQKHVPAPAAGLRELAAETLECVQDDGITVLRGAGMLLPEPWQASTLAFIDPYDISAVSDAGITPLELACELANRSLATLLFYTFGNEDQRRDRRTAMDQGLQKFRLASRTRCWEGALRALPQEAFTQWGFGLLALNLAPQAIQAVEQNLRGLESAYQDLPLEGYAGGPTASWALTCRAGV